MPIPTEHDLTVAIVDAAKRAFLSLFGTYPGEYYYCTLITTGEAHAPVVAAWSREALSTAIAKSPDPDSDSRALKWSYADSPYYGYGENYFDEVRRLFLQRPPLSHEMTVTKWNAECDLRISAMEAAMETLDEQGVFGLGVARESIVILVEVMPPDHTNTERAQRLNSPEALKEWLVEAAEG